MAKRENMSNRRGRLGVLLLTAALVCALLSGFAQAAPVEGGSATLEPAAPKPQITIQGNVVVSKGKPTGFYELALCVQTARTVTDNNTGLSAEAEYAALLAEAAETGDRTPVEEFLKTHTVTNYPFQSAAAAVHINLDALTAVTWGSGKPVYADWTGSYPSTTNSTYPRGIDRADPDQPKMFTDLQPILGGGARAVRLDTAKPDEVTNATALIEEAEFDAADAARRTALLTLSANTTTTANVVYEVPTPVVVVRFAYDMNRFTELEVGNPRDQVNAPNESDFWVGLDVNDRLPADAARTALTYLGAQDAGNPTDPYAVSDAQAAGSSVFQSVWYAQNMKSDGTGQEATHFYYYLGAEHCSPSGQASIQVYQEATGTDSSETLYVPKTAGSVVLADRNTAYATPGDPEAAAGGNPNYSFFQNLLQVRTDTLRLDLVNAETYRKPTGGGGITILFYDWDDSLIGSLIVDGGDVRSAVNEYLEKTLVHPELRTGEIIGGAKDLDALKADPNYDVYKNRVDSLERQYTYRGDYAYKVGEDGDATLIYGADHAQPGEDYPLTNKLDYAFYRRATTQTEVTDTATGITTRYFNAVPISEGDGSEDYDGYQYPYVYGWAIVEDETQDLTKKNWILKKDSVKTEDVWTTFGVGELGSLDPADTTTKTFTDTDGTSKPYTYAVTDEDAAWYLRFADFSSLESMLREGQDVLIVKAVYEPGESLLTDYHYTVVDGSLNVERYGVAASTGASVYSFQYQYRRANNSVNDMWRGVNRTREPAVKTGYRYDVNAFDSENQNLDPAIDTNTFFLKTLSNNEDILNIDMTTGGALWKLEYVLVDAYGSNFAAGTQRSAGEELNLKNNFFYTDGVEYSDRQGTDGFVLQATLNTLLTEANKVARGETGNLRGHMSRATLQDMNLRANAEGAEFTAGNYNLCATYLQDLVTRLYKDGVSIDPKTGDVTLGWHQIQRHILLCMEAGSAAPGIYDGTSLMSEDACAGFPWCRLDNCAAEMKVDIFNLGDIFVAMDKAKNETGDKTPAKDALNKLLTETPSLLDGYYQNVFRKDEDGRKFTGRTDMYAALEKVYKLLSDAGLTQDDMKQMTDYQVQELIITGTYPPTGEIYWWWNGGMRPVTTWQDFIEAGMLVVTGDVPDALDAMTSANLPDAVQDMISYAPPANAPANVGWFRYKDSEEDDNAFTSVEQFKTAWLRALGVLDDHYTLPADWDSIPWAEIQYALITGTYADATTVLSTTNYWWKDGGLPRLTYERLMDAVNDWRKGGYTDSSKLDALLAKSINPINNEVYIRRTAAGSGFTSAAQFKTALKTAMEVLGYVSNRTAFVDLGTNELKYTMSGTHKEYVLDVYQFQYLLLNASRLVGQPIPESGKIADPDDPDVKCNYWWIPEPHIPTSAQRIGDIMDLLTYAYWAKDGVNGTALTFDPLAQLDAATMERLKLRAEVHGIPYTDETQADLRQKVIDAITQATSGWPYNIDNFSAQSAADLTRELQNILLGNSYATSGSITDNYWWQGSGFQADTHGTLAQAAWIATVGFEVNGTTRTAADATNNINLDFVTRRVTMAYTGLAMRRNDQGEAFATKEALITALGDALKAARAADPTITYDSLANLTDYQLQYLILNGTLKETQDIKDELAAAKTDYWWFTADEPPKTEEGTKTELVVDPDEWTAFITAAKSYYKTQATFTYTLTDAGIKDTLRLRKQVNGAPAEIATAELQNGTTGDLLYRVLKAIWNSNKKSTFFNTKTKVLKKNPTWYEFQYILYNLETIEASATIPDTADCENEKNNWEWIWEISGGAVEMEQAAPDAATWDPFITAAKSYYKTQTTFTYSLSDTVVKDTLLLRRQENGAPVEITAAELQDGTTGDLLYRVLKAIWNSNKKSTFFNTKTKVLKKNPTWYEFQYILYNLEAIEASATIPDTEDCEAWATQENAPWVWREKAAGASLLTMEEDPPVPLAPLPEDMEPDRPDIPIEPALDELPAEPLGDEVRIRYLMAGPMILPLSLRRTK